MGVVPAPDIVWVGAAPGNYGVGRPAGVFVEAVVVHTTAGGSTIGSLDNWFRNPQAGVATTFGIGPNDQGVVEIHQYVSLDDTAYAQGIVNRPTSQLCKDNGSLSPNLWAVGCELVDGGVPGNHSDAQVAALAHLYAWVWETVIMPHGDVTGATDQPDRYRVIGHCELDSVNRAACPSWPEERFQSLIDQMTAWLHPVPVPPEPEPVPPPQGAAWQQLIDDYTATAIGLEDLATRATLQAQAARDAIARATAGG